MKTNFCSKSLGISFPLLLFVLLVVLLTPGCLLLLGAGAGAGGAAFVMGKLDAELDGSVKKVHGATVASLKSLDMQILKNQVDKLSGKVESKTADDKDVWIHLDSVTRSKTEISIRVGYLGDETRSRRILETIQKRL